MTPQRKRFIEKMTPAQRDVEVIIALGGAGVDDAVAQPRTGQAPINQAFVQLANVAGESVVIENYTSKDLEVRRGAGGTVYLKIPAGTGREIDVQSNANELYVRNATDNTTADFTYQVIGEAVL